MADNQIMAGIVFTTLLLLLLVAGIFLSIYMAGKERMQQQIKITKIELDYEKELRQVETEVSEKMMERFAQELHDNIGHILTCMRITIENKKLDEPKLDQTFQPIENYLNEATGQLRLLSRSLNTDYVSNIGLHGAIKVEVERLNLLRRVQVNFDSEGQEMLINKNQELMAFRIFQEMIHNSIKHSRAKNLYISLDTSGNFALKVADDGKGFAAEEILNSPKASGLKNMMKRAKMAGMDCKIESAPGMGCKYALYQTKTPAL